MGVPSSHHVPRPALRSGLLLYLRLEGTPTQRSGFRSRGAASEAKPSPPSGAEPRRGREADIYRDTEVKVQTALRPPRPVERKSVLGRFFGVAADPRAYTALFYMVLALATGIFYFLWVVAGISMSIGFAVLIIGIPFIILFFGSVRILSLVEGRLVEVMLGERMPRRPLYSVRGRSIWQLHLARGIGTLHGQLAKHLLVKSSAGA
ncbi:MAG: hypothetical protein GX538_01060 [Gammaproteobacteria bacterium]|nr:hypothetical protein [Gammaproteobacteria bacterium]